MEAWDPKEISKRFLVQAQEAERYSKEAKGKMSRTDTYQKLFDEHWAQFYVFDALHVSAYLASKEQLIFFLNQMLQNKPTPFGACDGDYFETQRLKCLNQLIAQYS